MALFNQHHVLPRCHLTLPLQTQNVHTVLCIPLRHFRNQTHHIAPPPLLVNLLQRTLVSAVTLSWQSEIHLQFAVIGGTATTSWLVVDRSDYFLCLLVSLKEIEL